MSRTRPGDDPTPRAGEGGAYRKTPTQLATDPAFTGTYVRSHVQSGTSLVRKLAMGTEPGAALVLGDSTGATTVRWFYRSLTALAAKFPAYTCKYFVWDDTWQAYLPPVTVQTGTAGARSMRVPNGTAYCTTPTSTATSITGDLDVRVKLSLDNWLAPSSQSAIAAKQEGAGQRSWSFEVATNGRLVLNTTADGTNTIGHTSTTSVAAAAGISNGATLWVRAQLDVDNGASGHTVSFAYSLDEQATWSPVGSDVVTATATSVFASTASTYFPGRTSGGYNPGNANFYELVVRNGIAGPVVLHVDFGALPPQPVATFQGWTGETWTVVNPGSANETRTGAPVLALYNGSMPGQVIAYSNDSTRGPKQTPYPADVAWINYSQNEGNLTVYRAPYKTLADFLVAKWPDVRVAAVVQSKRFAPAGASNVAEHDIRCRQISDLAETQRYGVTDLRGLFAPDNSAYLSDGVHPIDTSANIKWANDVLDKHFNSALARYGITAAAAG